MFQQSVSAFVRCERNIFPAIHATASMQTTNGESPLKRKSHRRGAVREWRYPGGPVAQEAERAGLAIRNRAVPDYAANGPGLVSALARRTALRARRSWRSTVRLLMPRRAAVSL